MLQYFFFIVAHEGKLVFRFLFLKCPFVFLIHKVLTTKNNTILYIKNYIKLELSSKVHFNNSR